ncbi:MAG: excinuclease ABC subunit UvrC, partial [Clostridia bacterium]|nr:excinuclease ABC subunit UvrC [Clostridia bacterium]
SYPYIKVNLQKPYPTVEFTRKRVADGAKYFGPYSGTTVAGSILKTVQKTFCLPTCKMEFPRDIGKARPCLYSHIGQCCAPCNGQLSEEAYRERFTEVISFLRGNYTEVKKSLTEKMLFASENLLFETAMEYRDRIAALENLWERQKVVGAPDAEYDVLALHTGDTCSCLAIYYVRGGAVIDSDNHIFTADKIVDESAIVSFIGELYTHREYIPKTLLIGFPLDEENRTMLEAYLSEYAEYKVNLRIPQKGELYKLCQMVEENAALHARQYVADSERDHSVLEKLAEMLDLPTTPLRIEAIDISNYGDEHITAGIIALEEGKLCKKNYRTYKIRSTDGQNDYGAMREALTRRFAHREEQPLPDLLLLDGGKGHVGVVKELLREQKIVLPVFGMVKDDFHKTRALTDGENEISIAREQAVFVLIYKIQEEVHRFTIGRMQGAKRKEMKRSSLEDIKGIGPKKAQLLLKQMGTLAAVKKATVAELAALEGISPSDAEAIRAHFDKGYNKK